MTRKHGQRRMLVATLVVACVGFAGCDTRAILDAVEGGFYGWISSSTAQLLTSFVPFP